MTDFLLLLSFSICPLMFVFVFSILTPAIGSVLTIRNEIMLALALPSVANAGMALGLLCGIDPERELLLYGFASIATLLSIFGTSRTRNDVSNREIYFASLFVGGQILSSIFSALSPVAHSHVSHLLNGEILAAGSFEAVMMAVFCVVFMCLAIVNRHSIFSWSADSEFFMVGAKRYRLFLITIYVVLAATITLGVATIGMLPVMTLLIIPALCGNVGCGGIGRYIVFTTGIGIVGSVGGFLIALAIDFPPAISVAAGVVVTGMACRVFYRKQ